MGARSTTHSPPPSVRACVRACVLLAALWSECTSAHLHMQVSLWLPAARRICTLNLKSFDLCLFGAKARRRGGNDQNIQK
eukprot:6213064-Pleurochrysis_carterae.AAC.1